MMGPHSFYDATETDMEKLANNSPLSCETRLVLLGDDSLVYEINDPTPGLLDVGSLMVRADKVDDYYSQWAASDYAYSFFRYVKMIQSGKVDLTDEDKEIFAQAWRSDGYPSFDHMLQGDEHDAEIFDMLAESAAENGGRTPDRAHAYIEECSYVHWAGQCADSFDFTPDPNF